jgi:uncharacterized protein YkwD
MRMGWHGNGELYTCLNNDYMNWVDILLILVVLFSAWMGWRKGFLHGCADLLTWIGALVLAFVCYPVIAEKIEKSSGPSLWIMPVTFLVCLFVFGALLGWLMRLLFNKIHVSVFQSLANHVLGIIPGLVNGVIWSTVIALMLLTMPFTNSLSENARQSRIADRLTPPAEWVEEKLSPVFSDVVRKSMTKLTVEPHSEEMIQLGFSTTRVKERPDLEANMLEMVNGERIKEGLPILSADTVMRKVAIAHSRDMMARGYFSHETPEHLDPFDRMKAAHIKYLAAGENLAIARTISIAHTGLMNSPGHRANILNPSYRRLGIGIIDGGLHGLMISQEFRN